MLHSKILAAIALAALTMAFVGCAPYETRSPMQLDVESVSISEYREFLTLLNEAVEEGEPRELNSQEKERFTRINSRLDRLLAKHDTLDSMDQEERLQLFNLHEQLQGVVIGREEDQIICRRQKQVGTNFRQMQCKTQSEWQEEQRNAHDFLSHSFRSTMEPPAGQ
jgi:hypothetical protein